MKKNYYSLLLAALCMPGLSYADVFTVGDLQYTTLNETTCELTKSFAGAVDLVIPSKVTNAETEYTVVSIKSGVFRSATITSCVVPGTITKPGPSLFNMCRSLKSVTFEEGVEELGYNSFPMCSQLTTVNLPSSLKVLGGEDALGFSKGSAFSGCTALTQITIPSGITAIPEKTFNGCSSLASVTFAGAITTIGESAFANCKALASELRFPDITSIGANAFSYCTSLKKIELGSGLETITGQAFYGCSSLDDIVLSEGLKIVGSLAFNGCGALKSLYIPSSVTELASESFKDCTGLTSVTCNSEVPPVASANTFPTSIYGVAMLNVPAKSEQAYRDAECWKLFENISHVTVGVDDVVCSNVAVKTVAGAIIIEGDYSTAEVYTVSGQLVARTSAHEVSLPAGLYVVRVGNATYKTIVK